jgi:hypothetical protein
MRLILVVPARARRTALAGLAAAAIALPVHALAAQEPAAPQQPPAAPQQPAQAAQPAAPQRVFGSDAGMIFNQIKPDKTADFEFIMGKLKEALQKSENPQRKQQAAGWRIFKSVEPGPGGNVLYIFFVNPTVKDADYTVSKILAEAFPAEVQDLYKKFSEAYVGGQSLVNLQLIQDLSGGGAAPAAAPPPGQP